MVRLIIDSGCDITQLEAAQLDITVLPMATRFGSDEYRDGADITHDEFYSKLINSGVFPSTSQITPYEYDQQFSEIVEAGDTCVCITMSSKISGCYQSATLAAESYPGKVYVVDSKSATVAERVLMDLAIRERAAGKSAEEIAAYLEEKRETLNMFAVFDTLEYLKRGGRLPAAAATIGNMLSIKPLITFKDGELSVMSVARGAKNADRKLIEYIKEQGGICADMPCNLTYTGLSDASLMRFIETAGDVLAPAGPLNNLQRVGACIGTHAGPGAYAIGFWGNNRH